MEVKVKFNDINVKEEKEKTLVKILMLKGEKGEKGDGDFNVIEDVKVNGTSLPVSNKSVNVQIPTDVSSFNNDSGYLVENDLQMVETLDVENGSQITDATGYSRLNKIYGDTEQNGTPSPSNKIDVEVVTGDTEIVISDNNGSSSQTLNLKLNNVELCKIGNYKDYIYKQDEKWYKHCEILKVVLDGSDTWKNTYGANLFGTTRKLESNPPASQKLCLCNYYKYNSRQSQIDANTVHGDFCVQYAAGAGNIYFKNTNYNNVTDWVSYLENLYNNGTPVTFYYPLNEAIEIEINDNEVVNSLNAIRNFTLYENETNFTISSDDLLPSLNISYAITNRDFYSKEETDDLIDDLKSKTKDFYFNSINDMKSYSLKEGDIANTIGYYSANDGGASKYIVVNDSTLTDDGGSVIDLNNGLKASLLVENDTINIKQFGAKGDGITDDGLPFQNALNLLSTSNIKKIILDKDKNYYVNRVLTIFKDSDIDLNNSTIVSGKTRLFVNFKSTQLGWDSNDEYTEYNGNGNIYIHNGNIQGGAISFIHGENIKLENLNFIDNNNDHYLEICACKNYYVLNCNFKGMKTVASGREYVEYIQIDVCNHDSFPQFPVGSATYDGTVDENLIIDNCTFKPSETTNYNNLYCAIGSHVTPATYHKNITIKNNKIDSPSYAGIYLIKVENANIENNQIINGTGNYGIDLQYGCKNVNIINNILNNVTGAILALANSGYTHENINIENNIVNVSNGQNAYVIHNCDILKLVNNIGITTTRLVDFTNCTHVICSNNTFDNGTNTFGNLVYISGINTYDTIDIFLNSLGKNDTTNHILTLNKNITDFNIMKLSIGSMANGNWQDVIIYSYPGRNFQLGEKYSLMYLDNNDTMAIISLTIDSEDPTKILYTNSGGSGIRALKLKYIKTN